MWAKTQCIFDVWKNSRIRNKQMFTNARAFSRESYFLYFFCFSHMFCGKKVVVVFLWNHIHICMPSFWFFIFVCDEKFHRLIKTLLLIIQFCLCILNSPRSKYFFKFSLMVFDSQICSANTIPQASHVDWLHIKKSDFFHTIWDFHEHVSWQTHFTEEDGRMTLYDT